jgi:two-component system KDP operon response regulator KdpE
MPRNGGLETCRSIREVSEVPIIIVTVRREESEKVELLDAERDDYITKPFGKQEVLARIRAALRRAPASTGGGPHRLVSEDLEIDFETRKVKAGNKDVRLTPKEFVSAALSRIAALASPFHIASCFKQSGAPIMATRRTT